MAKDASFLGIDFGTSKSTMSWLNPRTGQAEVIKNAEGEDKTPSVVYFGPDGVLVGTPAENMLDEEDERRRVVASVKRSLARPLRIALPDGRLITPVEVVVEILSKLKRDAEAGHFKESIGHAVLTCPAAFSQTERDALVDAAVRSGFHTVELLEEPVAAALAYAETGLKVEGHVLVYDLGGGTFDLAVLARDEDGFRPALEPRGLRACGGDDFDRALYDHCDELARGTLQRSVSGDDGIDLQFLRLCRLRKESLTDRERCEFSAYLPGGVRFKHALERGVFEGLIARHVEETVRLTRSVVDEARDRGHPVGTVVLIGGSSRVPLVQRLLLKDAGLPVEPQRWQQQDVAVALGAAYHGQSLWGNNGQKTFGVSLSSAGLLVQWHRQLRGEMVQLTEMGNLTAPARTIAKILALAPQDEVALEARRTLTRPLLDLATEAVSKSAGPTDGALWQTETYLSIAKVKVKLGDVQGATRSLEAATKACHAISNRPDDQMRIFEEIAALYRKIGAEDAARVALEAARTLLNTKIAAYDGNTHYIFFDREIPTLLNFGEALARLGDKACAKGWFVAAKATVPTLRASDGLTGEKVHDFALCSIAKSQAKAMDIVGAMATLKAVKDRDYTLADIAESQADARDFNGAIITAQTIADSCWKKREIFIYVAKKQASSGDVSDAVVAAAKTIADDLYQAMTLGEIALLQAKRGDIAGAISTVREVRKASYRDFFLSDLSEMARESVIESIVNGLIEMTNAKPDEEGADSFLISLFLTLGSARIRFGNLSGAKTSFDKAISLINLEGTQWPRLDVAILYAQLGEPVLAKRCFQAVKKRADASAKESDKWREYTKLTTAYLKAGDISAAKATADTISDSSKKSLKWEAYEKIAVAQASAGDIAGATATANSIPEEATNPIDSSNPSRAWMGSDPSRKWTAFMGIAAAQIRAGDIAGAKATVDEMPSKPPTGAAFRGIAAAQICSGDRKSLESGKHGQQLWKHASSRASIYIHAVECLSFSDGDSDLEFMPTC